MYTFLIDVYMIIHILYCHRVHKCVKKEQERTYLHIKKTSVDIYYNASDQNNIFNNTKKVS